MGTDVNLLVLDSTLGAVVCDRWLGGNATLAAAQEVLGRQPDCPQVGLECWANVEPELAVQIAAAGYAAGASPEEVATLRHRFPQPRYVWLIVRDF